MIHSWWMRERLQSFLDGELPEAGCAALAEHLERCVSCAASLHRMAVCDRLLTSHRPVPGTLSPAVSLALLERAMAEARAGRRGPGRGMTLLVWGLSSLLVVAASGAAAWWCRPYRTARSGAANPPRIADHPPDANRTPAVKAVFGSGPLMADTEAETSPKPAAKQPARNPEPRAEKKPSRVPRPSPAPNEPRIHRPLSLRHRLIARGGPSTHFLHERREKLHLGLASSRDEDLTGAATSAMPDSRSPAVGAGEQAASMVADRWYEREAIRVVTAALDGDAGAVDQVAEALADSHQGGPAAGGLRPDHADLAEVPAEPHLVLPEWPLPWEGDDPQNRRREALLPSPQLLVMVSTEPAHSPVIVSEAPADTPGYSRVIACRPDAFGQATWMQATASTDARSTRTALVLLGDEVWEW